MKPTKILGKAEEHIDWDKPMWVISEIYGGMVILTTGEHNGGTFTGTALPCSTYPDGWYSKYWTKESFTPLTEPITIIEISN